MNYDISDYDSDRIHDPLRSPIVINPVPPEWAANAFDPEEEEEDPYRSPYARSKVGGSRQLKYLAAAVVVVITAVLWPTIMKGVINPLGDFLGFPPKNVTLSTSSSQRFPFTSSDPASKRQNKNLSPFKASLAPFWRSYRDILTSNVVYETYFDPVDEATGAINKMWASIPSPDSHLEELNYNMTRTEIRYRENNIVIAKNEWNRFLAARAILLRDLVGSGGLWRVYENGKLAAGDRATMGGKLEILRPDTSSSTSSSNADSPGAKQENVGDASQRNEPPAQKALDRQTLAALTMFARRILEELSDAHSILFKEQLDQPHFMTALEAARTQETSFVGGLRSRSSNGVATWTGTHAVSLRELQKRLQTNVLDKRDEMKVALEALRERFSEKKMEEEEPMGYQAWLSDAKELLQSWATVLIDAQEGVLFSLRTKELENVWPGPVDYKASWDTWKTRNCGRTSCYDQFSYSGYFKRLFLERKPMAGVALDEAKWSRAVGGEPLRGIWRGVYEKACCEDGKLAELLKFGSKQPVT
ncbi:hypothetical protein F5Y16DRAFT_418145 [Xylariaceae sp. FL0255]|nr:hypothetical protein F5Y16DRAFT_418145 [Xylariaceae sp. FL0255]